MSQSGIFRFLPIAEWLPDCTSKILRIDIIAGLAVAGLLIPQGMAYAGIAGVPPQVSDGVRDLLTRSGFLERLGNDRILSGVDIAVDAFLKASPPSTEQPISFAQTHA
jgi:SulP family sulfate permease